MVSRSEIAKKIKIKNKNLASRPRGQNGGEQSAASHNDLGRLRVRGLEDQRRALRSV